MWQRLVSKAFGLMLSPDAELTRTALKYPFPVRENPRPVERALILHHARKRGVGAEIGAFRGRFSEVLVETLDPKMIYLVDAWTRQGHFFAATRGSRHADAGAIPTAVAKREVELRMKRFVGLNVRMVEGYFAEATARIDEKLDWIYLGIGGQTGFLPMLEDLHRAAALIKDDGLIFGDDWHPDPGHARHDIYRAVQTFIRMTDFQLVAAGIGLGDQFCLGHTAIYDPPAAPRR